MAIPSNLTVTPSEGNGNKTISVTSKTKPTGRNDVRSSITGKIVGQSNSVTINVTEKGKAEFVTFSGKDKTVHVGEDGKTIEITGTSNSSKLTFSWSTNEIGIPNVTSFTVNNDTPATSGTAITGDPGATAQYTFKVSIVVPKNNTTDNRDSVLKVTCNTTSKLFCRFGVSIYDIAPPGLNFWNLLSNFSLENASISSNTGTW